MEEDELVPEPPRLMSEAAWRDRRLSRERLALLAALASQADARGWVSWEAAYETLKKLGMTSIDLGTLEVLGYLVPAGRPAEWAEDPLWQVRQPGPHLRLVAGA